MSVIMNPDDLRGPVLLAIACNSEGDRAADDNGRVLCVGEGDLGAFTEMELESSSDMVGLRLENGYSEYSLFLGGTALVMVAVSTVMVLLSLMVSLSVMFGVYTNTKCLFRQQP